ncbi:MAG TPA: hypothetical protein VL551_28240 [Actinospica sp.]|jgi:hypothetical protein|nr:hypothetical protein [Actinospica sp.]
MVMRGVRVPGLQARQRERAACLQVVRIPVHARGEVVAGAHRLPRSGRGEAVVEQPRRVRPDPDVAARGGLGELGLGKGFVPGAEVDDDL